MAPRARRLRTVVSRKFGADRTDNDSDSEDQAGHANTLRDSSLNQHLPDGERCGQGGNSYDRRGDSSG